MSHITQEPSKEEFALGSFLSAMHESKLDGRAMRAAMLKALGMDGAALAQPEPVSNDFQELAKVYASSYASPHHITFTTDGLKRFLAAQPEPEGWNPSDKHMTSQRALYFIQRFKKEEKLLGPNEQSAVDYVINMLKTTTAQPEPVEPFAYTDPLFVKVPQLGGMFSCSLKSFGMYTTPLYLQAPAQPEPVEPVLDKQMLWLWKNGDHYLAFDNLYPCFTQGGDPMTLGEPAAKAIFRTSFAAAKGGAL